MKHPGLWLDWATHAAALYACKNWHYSKSIPVRKQVRVGVWEDDVFVGVVTFSQGATPEYGKRFGIQATEVCELTRVALSPHKSQTSQVVALAMRFLRRQCPGLRLVISFADSGQGHHGGIYQAMNWIYDGSPRHHAYRVNGKDEHPKTLHNRYGIGGQSVKWLRANVDPNACRVVTPPKHRYLMPLDAAMRKQILPLAKPYPKRVGSDPGDTAASPADKGGSTPTPTLHLPEAAP